MYKYWKEMAIQAQSSKKEDADRIRKIINDNKHNMWRKLFKFLLFRFILIIISVNQFCFYVKILINAINN